MSLFLCKNSGCDYVYPIVGRDSLGNSLSTINLNFRQLDIQMCGLENEINTTFNPALTLFNSLSSQLNDAFTVVSQNSACWNNTYSTVAEMSGFWLSPITMIYPYPFTASSDISIIQQWLNENISARNGTCFNYIVGQQLFIFSPEYFFINRNASNTTTIGKKQVIFYTTASCINRKINVQCKGTVDCGAVNSNITLQDQFINKFVGIQFTLDQTLQWSNGIKLFE
jgi:hypothetical protein